MEKIENTDFKEMLDHEAIWNCDIMGLEWEHYFKKKKEKKKYYYKTMKTIIMCTTEAGGLNVVLERTKATYNCIW